MPRYNAVLKLADFSEPAFSQHMSRIFQDLAAHYPNFPSGHELAKAWEVTQAVRALSDFGVLHRDAEILGVGAGFEQTVFFLTNFVKRVFATDLYATNDAWREADAGMLRDPGRFAPEGMRWEPNRLVVQHMDALDLRYEDNSFDGVFSCGSIEHFGSLENVAQAAREMGRVLKPGGILCLSTEYRISGPQDLGIAGTILFTRELIEEHIINASGLRPVDPLDTTITEDTRAEAYPLQSAVDNGVKLRSIALTHDGFTWTSVALCLQKPLSLRQRRERRAASRPQTRTRRKA